MKSLRLKYLLAYFLLSSFMIVYAAEQDFSLTYKENVYGNIKMIGNTVLEADTSKDTTSSSYFLSDDEVAYGRYINNGEITQLWSNSKWNNINYQANNFAFLRYVNTDSSTAGVFNASSSTLTIPSGAKIIFARLYWTGLIHDIKSGTISGKKTNSKTVKIKASSIDLGDGVNSYTDLTVNQTNNYASNEGWADIDFSLTAGNFSMYSAYKDINLSSYTSNGSPITFTVANVASEEGWMRNYGNFGAWSLVVVYEHVDESFKNISLFTGYKQVYQNPEEFEITGFVAPMENEVKSTLSFFAAEGEKTLNFGNDYLKVSDKDGTFYDVTNNTAYPNGNSNIFDSTITNDETRNPAIQNNMGIDIDTFEIGKDGDATHPQIIDNLQTSTTIQATSVGDAYYLNAMAISTELFSPQLCYDYAYSQQGQYFTEENNGLEAPMIVGNVLKNEPIKVKIYIRNTMASDVILKNVSVDVDIDEEQATYIRESTYLANQSAIAENIPDSTLSVADSYINNISIGSMTANDYFYLYYDINPKVNDLNISLDVTMNYDLEIDSTILNDDPLSTQLGRGSIKIPMCTSSNFNYQPTKGIFNIVHNDYYSGSNQYYNLPTQVVKRPGNFKLISLDPNNLDTLKPVATLVGVEMIDAGIYHDTNASCTEQDAAITPKVWSLIWNTTDSANEYKTSSVSFTQTDIENAINEGRVDAPLKSSIEPLLTTTDAPKFYNYARENAAFRVSYNLHPETGDIVQLEPISKNGETRFNVTNFPDLEGNCLVDVDNNPTNTDKLKTFCSNAGTSFNSAMKFDELQTCMRCAYGDSKRYVCSRDNFAIRPEAFMLKIDNQSQINSALQATLIDESGKIAPQNYDGNLSAGYKYNLEAVATSHIDNNPSFGYTKSLSNVDQDRSHYVWNTEPTPGACNDTSNKVSPVRFVNGAVDTNTSVQQVGKYTLEMIDKSWTSVDFNPQYMTHHNGPYFLGGTDCKVGTSQTYPRNTFINISDITNASLNGCEIKSTHTNPTTASQFVDYNVTFHPFKIDTSSVLLTVGINDAIAAAGSFVYTNSFIQPNGVIYNAVDDYNTTMAVTYSGWLRAIGYDDSTLSNFVTGCYAKDLNVSLGNLNAEHNTMSGVPVPYQYRLHIKDENGTVTATTPELTNLDVNVTQEIEIYPLATHFNKNLNGGIDFYLNLNYYKNISDPMNPKQIAYRPQFNRVSCLNQLQCGFHIYDPKTNTFTVPMPNPATSLTVKTQSDNYDEAEFAIGIPPIPNVTITHYFGRSYTPRQRYAQQTGVAPIFYEVYCNQNGNTALLQPNSLPSQEASPSARWYLNQSHIGNTYANPTTVTQKTSSRVTGTDTTGNHPDSTSLTYDGSRGFPYTTTMQHNADSWLIYNKDNPNALANEFEVEFIGGQDGSWAGRTDTNATTDISNTAPVTNRRIMW
ncbi:MAG: hypothetical protein PHI89_02370 [Thiovulaceae bacterium]|nr:hypothetical protein [Sulfurimonadaceae bacterium]